MGPHVPAAVGQRPQLWVDPLKHAECTRFLQWALPRLGLRWPGFRRARGRSASVSAGVSPAWVYRAEAAVNELKADCVPESDIHAIAREGVDLGNLPVAEEKQLREICCKVERVVWKGNLSLFGIALAGLLVSMWQGSAAGIVTAAAVMLLTFFAGERFAATVPSVHLTEFRDALSHGEILVAVDLPKKRLPQVHRMVVTRHPEVVRGGVSWTWPALERG